MSRVKHLVLLSILLLAGGCSMLQLERPPERDAAMRLDQGLASLDAGLYAEAFDDLAWVYSNCAGHTASHQALAALAALELDPRNPAGRESVGAELLGRLIQHPGPPAWTRPLSEAGYLMALALGASAPVEAPSDSAGGTVGPDSAARTDAAGSADGGAVAEATRGVWRAAPEGTAESSRSDGAGSDGAAMAGRPADEADEATPESPPPAPAEVAGAVYGCGAPVPSGDWVAPRLPTLPGPSLVSILAATETERTKLTARTDSLSRVLATTQRELQETRAELERIRKTLKP